MNSLRYKVMSVLLCYPEQGLIDALPDIQEAITGDIEAEAALLPLISYLSGETLIPLQENYVSLFDRNPGHSLHLFEHIHGESRDRGQAMVDLLGEYRLSGFEATSDELPDYIPLILEFMSGVSVEDSDQMLGEAVHVLAVLRDKLISADSPYSGIFSLLCEMTDVEPMALAAPPVRDMDEVMEQFGPGVDGTEPLLRPSGGPQVMTFYPKAGQAATPSLH